MSAKHWSRPTKKYCCLTRAVLPPRWCQVGTEFFSVLKNIRIFLEAAALAIFCRVFCRSHWWRPWRFLGGFTNHVLLQSTVDQTLGCIKIIFLKTVSFCGKLFHLHKMDHFWMIGGGCPLHTSTHRQSGKFPGAVTFPCAGAQLFLIIRPYYCFTSPESIRPSG